MSSHEKIENRNQEKIETLKTFDEMQENNNFGHQSNNLFESSNSELLMEKSSYKNPNGTRNSSFIKVKTEKSSFSMIESLKHREIGKNETNFYANIENSGNNEKNQFSKFIK